MDCELLDSFRAWGYSKCFRPSCFSFPGSAPGPTSWKWRGQISFDTLIGQRETRQPRACVPDPWPPACAPVCQYPSPLSSPRSAASFPASSFAFSSESFLIRCLAMTRLLFQSCQTWFVCEPLKSKLEFSDLVWLVQPGCPCLLSSIFWCRRGSSYRWAGTNWSHCKVTVARLRRADVSHVNILGFFVIFLFSHPREATSLDFSSAAETGCFCEATCEFQSIPALRFNITIIYKDSRDFPPSFRRVYSSSCTWFSHLPGNSNEMQIRCRHGATWGNNTNLYHRREMWNTLVSKINAHFIVPPSFSRHSGNHKLHIHMHIMFHIGISMSW